MEYHGYVDAKKSGRRLQNEEFTSCIFGFVIIISLLIYLWQITIKYQEWYNTRPIRILSIDLIKQP